MRLTSEASKLSCSSVWRTLIGVTKLTFSAATKLGTYEIVGPLGADGMGQVYRARDSKLKREEAIKVSFCMHPPILKAAGRGGAGPVIDGWLIPHDPGTIFAQGKQNDVPVLVGSNRDESFGAG